MKAILILINVIFFTNLVKAQIFDSLAVPRNDKHYKISPLDSILIKDMMLGFSRYDTIYFKKLVVVLDDCSISRKTKTTLVDLLFKEGDYIDPKLFKVLSETLFFIGYEDYYIVDNPNWVTDFYILDIIYNKKNAFDFCEYVIDNNILNQCILFYPKCYRLHEYSDFYSKNEMFLKKFADMYKNADQKKLDSIIFNTDNICISNNLFTILNFIKNK